MLILSPQSNILIDDEGKAKLCDFGLSSIVVEFCGTSSLTSCIGGAVRWADASLYSLSTDDDEVQETPALTTRSDIYSFGSVTLEVGTPFIHSPLPIFIPRHRTDNAF